MYNEAKTAVGHLVTASNPITFRTTRTFCCRSEYDFNGWEIQDLPGFDAISIDKAHNNNVERWSALLAHDAIEHDPNIAPGTGARERDLLRIMAICRYLRIYPCNPIP